MIADSCRAARGVHGVRRSQPSEQKASSVEFGDMDLHSVWQAWHLATWTVTLCGKRGTYGLQLALVTRLVPVGAAALLPGSRGIWRHRPSFPVAGVALGDIDLHFVWQAWYLRHSAGSGDALGSRVAFGDIGSPLAPRLFCVAGVEFGDIDLHSVWQAWHLATWTVTLRGRRGTYGTQLALVTRLVPIGAAALLRGRHGIWRHRLSLRVAGVARVVLDAKSPFSEPRVTLPTPFAQHGTRCFHSSVMSLPPGTFPSSSCSSHQPRDESDASCNGRKPVEAQCLAANPN
eukprot:s534_g32.t1